MGLFDMFKKKQKTNTTSPLHNDTLDQTQIDEDSLIWSFNNGVLVIPEGVTKIDEDSLAIYNGILKIVLPSTIVYIGSESINDMTLMETLDFSKVKKLKEIPDNMILGQTCIKSFMVPFGVEYVGDCFLGDSKLIKEVYIPETVNKIYSLNGNGNHEIDVFLFSSKLDIEYLQEDVRNLYVLPQSYRYYAKQILDLESDTKVIEMPPEKVNFYKLLNQTGGIFFNELSN